MTITLTGGEARAVAATALHRPRLVIARAEFVSVDAIDARRRSAATKANLDSVSTLEPRVLQAFADAYGMRDLESCLIGFLLEPGAVDAIRRTDAA